MALRLKAVALVVRLSAGGGQEAAVVALHAVLLQHRLHLREEVLLFRAFAGWRQRAGGDDEKEGKETQDHAASLTTALKTSYPAFAQSCAAA